MQLFAGLEADWSALQGLQQSRSDQQQSTHPSVWLLLSAIDLNNTNMNRDELNKRVGVTDKADAGAMPPVPAALPSLRLNADAGAMPPLPAALPSLRLNADAHMLPRAQGSSMPHIRNGTSASPSASAATKQSDGALGLKHAAHALIELAGAKRANIDMENDAQRKPDEERTGKRLVGCVGFNGSVLFRSHKKYNLIKRRNLTLEEYVQLIRSAKMARNDAHKSIRTCLPKKVQKRLGTKDHGRRDIHSHLLDMWRNMSDSNKMEYNRCAREMRYVLK